MLLAQRRRGFLRQAQPASVEARCLSFRRRSTDRYQPLRLRDQRRPKALHMDGQPRQNHRRRQKRAPSVRFNPLDS